MELDRSILKKLWNGEKDQITLEMLKNGIFYVFGEKHRLSVFLIKKQVYL